MQNSAFIFVSKYEFSIKIFVLIDDKTLNCYIVNFVKLIKSIRFLNHLEFIILLNINENSQTKLVVLRVNQFQIKKNQFYDRLEVVF